MLGAGWFEQGAGCMLHVAWHEALGASHGVLVHGVQDARYLVQGAGQDVHVSLHSRNFVILHRCSAAFVRQHR